MQHTLPLKKNKLSKENQELPGTDQENNISKHHPQGNIHVNTFY